jgi:hypothetical protein
LILDIAQTVLIFVGVPLAVIAIVAALVYAGGGKNRAKRYRPGRSYDFAPVWFTSSAKPVGPEAAGRGGHELVGRKQAALPASTTASAPGVTGGASDRW